MAKAKRTPLMRADLRERCSEHGMPPDISNTDRWHWLNNNWQDVLSPAQEPPADDDNAASLKDAPEHLRCICCWSNYGGLGKPVSNSRMGNVRRRHLKCNKCSHSWTIDMQPKDFWVDGQWVSILTLDRIEHEFIKRVEAEEHAKTCS